MSHTNRWFVAIAALMISAEPAIAELPAGIGFLPLPNTRLRSVCAAENGFSQVSGAWGCPAITGAWNGGIFDTKRNRMIIWGGGHNDYYGNELYAINLDTQTVERLNSPGLPTATSCTEGIVGNTQPNSRHTYDGIEYVPTLDRMFVFGGSLACSQGYFGDDTWMFDFSTMSWSRITPSGTNPRGEAGMMTAFDPVSGLIYLHDRLNLYSFDPSANRYTRLSSTAVSLGYHMVATVDPKRRKFVIAGYDRDDGGGRVYAYDIGPGSNFTLQRISTIGSTAIINDLYPGFEYDPVGDRFVAWGEGSRNNVYFLNFDTRVWTTASHAGGPVPVGNGTHGRFRYSPKDGVFVVVNRVDDNAVILRLSDQVVSPPQAPGNLTVQ